MIAAALLLALCIDWVVGWPDALYRRIGHPVTWMGAGIDLCDRWLNREGAPMRVLRGAVAVVLVVGISAGIAAGVAAFVPDGVAGTLILAVLAWPFIAARSLKEHVEAVQTPLGDGDLATARSAVAMIVGRDVDALDASGVARASLESLAENTSDGVVAPLFWGVLLGMPGLVGYKAVNTLDSMIGHRTARHDAFGRVAARLDDLVNLIPARLTALIFAILSARPRQVLHIVWRDAGLHRSPNAGWPEATLAAGLGVRLSGPRAYGATQVEEPWVNPDGRDPTAQDIRLGLGHYQRLLIVLAAGLALLALI